MITIIFEDDIDFYFARQRVTEKLAQAGHLSAAGRRALPGPRRHRTGPDLLVHRRDRARSIPIDPGRLWALNKFYIAPQLNAAPGVAEVASSAACRWSTRSTCGPKTCGPTASRSATSTRPSPRATCRPAAASSRRTTPSTSSAASAGFADEAGHRKHRHQGDQRHADLREERGHRAARHAVSPQRLREGRQRSDGGVVLMRHGENPLAVTRARQGEDPGAAAGPARGRAHRAGLRPDAADPRRDPHAHRGHVARDADRLDRHPADSDARPQRVRHLRHAAAVGAVLVPADVGAAARSASSTSRPTSCRWPASRSRSASWSIRRS